VASHCCQDQFDVVAAHIIPGPKMDALVGLEIKSKKDTLKRLDNQIAEYLHIFDLVYVVLEEHQPPASLPPFVGIIRAGPSHLKNAGAASIAPTISGAQLIPIITDQNISRPSANNPTLQSHNIGFNRWMNMIRDGI
jgi:hypothetical protein